MARTTAGTRTDIPAYRITRGLIDMGVTNLWDFRTGFSGGNSSTVVDMIGDIPVQWFGTTALSSVYTSGEYSADLEADNSDYFASQFVPLNVSSNQISVFAWVKWESAVGGRVLAQWNASNARRCFMLSVTASGAVQLLISNDGTNSGTYQSPTSTITTGAWHLLTASFDLTNKGQTYFDGVAKSTTLTSGTEPVAIFNPTDRIGIGCQTAVVNPGTFFDGKMGVCGILQNKIISAQEVTDLYNATGRLGRYF